MNIFLQFLEAVKGLFTPRDITEKLGIAPAVSEDMTRHIRLWSDCYANRAPWLDGECRNMHLPSSISKELARLVTLEFNSVLSGGKRAEFLAETYAKTVADAPVFTEYACAKGGIMLKPYIADGKISTAYIQADSFYPTRISPRGEIVGCAFIERRRVKGRFYTRIEVHDCMPQIYVIRNYAFVSDCSGLIGTRTGLDCIPEWSGLREEVTLTGVSRPLYSYFKMPGANQIDSSSPLGVSVFANAIDAIRDADEQYARLLWEFEGSELAVNVDITAIDPGRVKLDKHEKRLYRGLDVSDSLYEVFSPAIRDASLLNGLNSILRNVEQLSGLAFGTISNTDEYKKTATEIKESRQRSYCTVSAIQRSLQNALQGLAVCYDELCTLYSLAPDDGIEQSFEFDDSLITDSETNQRIWLREVEAGIMSREEYRMRRYGETEKTARERVGDIGE